MGIKKTGVKIVICDKTDTMFLQALDGILEVYETADGVSLVLMDEKINRQILINLLHHLI